MLCVSQNSETSNDHSNYIIIVVKFIELRSMVPISAYLLTYSLEL